MNRQVVCLAIAACGLAASASADIVTLNGTGTSISSLPLSASATFTVTGTTMTVLLTNTYTGDTLVPSDVLTALFFRVNGGSPTFTPVSAVIGPGSGTIYDSVPLGPGGVVGGEWDYASGLNLFGGMTYGISSSGLGIFGSGGDFPGANLAGPPNGAVDGLQYGIVSAGDNAATGNGGITGTDGLVRNSVLFTFTCPQGFNVSSIDNVYFLYGTATNEGGYHNPTPGAAGVLGLGAATTLRRRRRA